VKSTTFVTARAVLVDIEGTTSTMAFVHDVLFPYAEEHLDAYVAAHREEPAVARALRDAAQLAGLDPDADDAAVLAHLHTWIAEDRKATPLKTLQGLVWAEGYAQSALRGHVYLDAAAGLRRWHGAGLKLYVYSSGSVEAQRVLFANSVHGDLMPLFSANFDTKVGSKREPASYSVIAYILDLVPHDMVFLSDVDAELDAAQSAGMQTIRLLRPADTPAGATTRHPSIVSFDELHVELPE